MQLDASSTYFGPVPCPCDLVPMGEKQEKEVFHEKYLMELDENYEEPLESKDVKSPEFSKEKADLKSPKVFSEDLELNSPSFSMEPSIKRRKKHTDPGTAPQEHRPCTSSRVGDSQERRLSC